MKNSIHIISFLFFSLHSQKDIANIKNEMEKRQKDGDAVFTDNNSNNTTAADDKGITADNAETATPADASDDIPSNLLNGDNANNNNNNQQTTADVIAY